MPRDNLHTHGRRLPLIGSFPEHCGVQPDTFPPPDHPGTSLIISHIGVHETRALFSITSSKIYSKDKREQVQAIIFNKFMADSNTFLFNTVKPKIGHKLCVCRYK